MYTYIYTSFNNQIRIFSRSNCPCLLTKDLVYNKKIKYLAVNLITEVKCLNNGSYGTFMKEIEEDPANREIPRVWTGRISTVHGIKCAHCLCKMIHRFSASLSHHPDFHERASVNTSSGVLLSGWTVFLSSQ
jgi:hypothetical protein